MMYNVIERNDYMTTRIARLTEITLNGDMYNAPTATEFDREDIFLSKTEMETKRLCEYIMNQEPKLTKYQKMTGFFQFNESIVGDAFHRSGHKATREVQSEFYCKPVDNISTFEWQHATADYRKVLQKGIFGIIDEIDKSLKVHSAPDEIEFLNCLKKIAYIMIDWANKCADRAEEFAKTVEEEEYKQNLLTLADTLRRVPANKPTSLYEAVLCIYVCFSADPDSVGTLDRYLREFYNHDIENGIITRETAQEYLQELFLMLQSATPKNSYAFTRGGESHFCVGGYLPDGTDSFDDLSRLIIESLTELPTYIPQVTLRWTSKTPREVLRFAMDRERKDPHKRIAFTNDDKRIKCYTEICGIPFEKAITYTTVGCNEPAFTGAITGSTSKGNILRCVETLFHKKSDEIINAQTFDEFYAVFERELYSDMTIIYDYDNKYNACRARDTSYISSLFFNDCIENAKSLTQGGGNTVIAAPMLIGLTNVIDSLCIVKQFVFEEKLATMAELINAVKSNWEGYDDLHLIIRKKGKFFGNDDELSNSVAQRFYNSIYNYLKDKTNLFGYHFLVGDLIGYNIHHQWFGEGTKATPDGRHSGEMLKFGISQSGGNDRNGLTALLNSIAKVDLNAIACGSTVTNISIDEQLIKNDEYFEKTVDIFETYFKNGGVHFQLNYVSREELLAAKETPDDYRNLRVRVSGFSDYFVKLRESLQDDIIARTNQK